MKTLKGIEVFGVGKWNGMLFQSHDLAAMAQAFDELKDVHKVPLKMGHNADQPMTDGKPALGWVSALYVKGDKLVADLSDVPDVVAKAIDNKLYRRVSIELSIDVRYKGKFIPFVVDGVALLGADLPAVNTLADLNAYMSKDGAQFTVSKHAAFSAVAGSLKETEMDEKELKAAVDTAVEAAVAPLKAEFAKSKTANETLTTENTALKQQLATFKVDADKAKVTVKRDRVKAVLEGLTAGGVLMPAQREAFTKALGVEDDTKVMALDIESFLAGFGVKESIGANGKAAFAKEGAGGKEDTNVGIKTFEEASETLDKRTRELMGKDKSLTYSAAKTAALEADESLASVYSNGPTG